MEKTDDVGVLLCASYGLAPNLLAYCGPDTRGDLEGYLNEGAADGRLVEHLAKFETLYPYLQIIATANRINDPFDRRVVEAYWLGNGLLEKVGAQVTYEALKYGQKLPKRLPKKEMKWLLTKIDKKARLHHTFHVLNVFTRTGYRMVAQTVETMDDCRISWGHISQQLPVTSDQKILIKSQKLEYKNGKLRLVPAIKEVIVMQESLARRLKPGDWVSAHWGIGCDQISEKQVKALNYYTEQSLKLANETI